MLYFAYGSNLSFKQMRHRCKESKYLENFILKGYKLVFSNYNSENTYGYANVEKKIGFKVLGALWDITKNNEKNLDVYEDVPRHYQKEYFILKGKKVLFYKQNKFINKKPSLSYIKIIIEGYKDCNLDINFLKKRVSYYDLDYNIKW